MPSVESRSPFLLPAVVGFLLLAVIAGVFVWSRSSGDAPVSPSSAVSPSPSASASDPGPDRRPKTDVLLLTDGWSLRIAGSNDVIVTDADGDRDTVTFAPIDGDTLQRVLRDAPAALVPLLGRMFPMTDDIVCTVDGCAVDGEPVTLQQLADASTVPDLGPSYAGWGVPAVLYAAQSSVAADTRFEASIAGGESVPLIAPVSSPEALEGEDFDLEALASDPYFGFNAGVYPVSTAFVRTFVPDPVWVSDRFEPRFPFTGGEVPELSVLEEIAAGPVPFLDGLNAPEPAAADLDGAALTWLSSPSSGCGPGVMCTPEAVPYAIVGDLVDVRVEKACSPDGDLGVIIRDALIDVSYPYPTHQTGAWYEQSSTVKPLSDKPAAAAFWRGTPALASGDVSLRVTTGAYYAGDTPLTPELVRFTGRASMPGFDADAQETLDEWVARNFSAERNQVICTGS